MSLSKLKQLEKRFGGSWKYQQGQWVQLGTNWIVKRINRVTPKDEPFGLGSIQPCNHVMIKSDEIERVFYFHRPVPRDVQQVLRDIRFSHIQNLAVRKESELFWRNR